MQIIIRDRTSADRLRGCLVAASLALSSVLAGCGGFDGIELQGGVFDALGVSSSAQEKNKKSEPKVAARPGLVLPPGADRLPPPGAPPEAEQAQLSAGDAWPVEPEANKARAKAELEKKHKEFCENAIRNARISGQSTNTVQGPNGSCQPSLFGGLTGMFEGERK